jgi:hypothetical protein
MAQIRKAQAAVPHRGSPPPPVHWPGRTGQIQGKIPGGALIVQRKVRAFLGDNENRFEVILPNGASIHLERDSRDTVEDLRRYLAEKYGLASEEVQVGEWIADTRSIPADDGDWLIPHLIYQTNLGGTFEVELKEDTGEIHVTVENSKRSGLLRFSLARHHFEFLSKGGKEKNSLYSSRVQVDDVVEDCKRIGRELVKLWFLPSLPAVHLFTVNGRTYKADVVGSGTMLNHFYVISGTNVYGNLTEHQHLLIFLLATHQENLRGHENEIRGQWAKASSFSIDIVVDITGMAKEDLLRFAPPQQQPKSKKKEEFVIGSGKLVFGGPFDPFDDEETPF